MKAASISKSRFPPIEQTGWLDSDVDAPGAPLLPDPRPRARAEDGEAGKTSGRDAAYPHTLLGRAGPAWRVVQRVDDPDPARANAQALADLGHGATGLSLVFQDAPNAFGAGLPPTSEAVERVLEGVPLGRMHLRMDAHPLSRPSVDWLVAVLTSRRVDPSRLSLSFGLDPAAILSGTGRLNMSLEALKASMPQSLAHFFAMGFPAVLLEADGRVAHNAGASEAQELGIMLATAISHLRMFEDARQPLIYAAPHIGFAISVDQDQFMSIIKIRALRKLWTMAQETCSIPPTPTVIHAESSYRMLSSTDSDINKLRTAFAGLGAIAGGVDTLSLLPDGVATGSADSQARRFALDSQLLLARESYAVFAAEPRPRLIGMDGQVAALCEAAWDEFRLIEKEGGMLESLAAGKIQERVMQSRSERAKARTSKASDEGQAAHAASPPAAATPEADGAMCRPLPAGLIEHYVAEEEPVG